MTPFYQRWLTVGAIYGVVVGLWLIALALFPESLRFDLVGLGLFWPDPARAGSPTAVALLATAVSGALTAGLSLIAWSLRPVFQDPAVPAQVGRAFAHGIIGWFVLDSAASVLLGSPMNVLGNLSFAIAVLPPTYAFILTREPRRP